MSEPGGSVRRITPAVIEAKKRREREDAAKRLQEVVPDLSSLCLRIHDRADGLGALPLFYIRHVVIATAPALFELPCADNKCEEGGHDVTRPVMTGLRSGEPTMEGRSRCPGHRGDKPCSRELKYLVNADYGGA
jgi:hypothetical protein